MPTIERRFTWVAAFALMVLRASSGQTQEEQGQLGRRTQQVSSTVGFAVVGRIDDRAGNPIPDVDVALIVADSVLRAVRSDALGRFRVEGIATDRATLRFKRLGFQSKDVIVDGSSGNSEVNVAVRLEASVASLDPVKVNDDAEPEFHDSRLAEFQARRASGKFAHFLDEKMISSSHATFLSDVLRKVPGVVVRPGSRMGNVVRLRNCASSVSEGRGAPLVWVDGVRIPNTEVDDAARVADVAGIEIYPSLAGVPATYFDRSASCGTILIWTKSRQ